jgi:hypothetical protein
VRVRGNTVGRPAERMWIGFLGWAAAGVVGAFAFAVFGTLAGVSIIVGLSLAATRPALRRSWFGFLVGAGTVSLYFAFLDRRGPGTFCWHTATAAGCDQYLSPWPWLVAGVSLFVAGCVGQALRARGSS